MLAAQTLAGWLVAAAGEGAEVNHPARPRPLMLHADCARVPELARTKPLDSKPGRYRPPDALLGFLDGL